MAFKLIVESGSTKTDWVLINTHHKHIFSTPGINPAANETMYDLSEYCSELINFVDQVETIHYFGAGIINTKTQNIIKGWLLSYFRYVKNWQIESDMLGAAISCCGSQSGIVCILGTGSNSCVYDGKTIIKNIPALGFALSNEGGGSKIGSELIKAYFYNRLPDKVRAEFSTTYNLQKSDVVEHIYLRQNPTAYLASFAKFLNSTRDKKWRNDFLFPIFQEFIDIRVKQYSEYINYDLHFVGSIAYFYADVIKKVLQTNKMECTSITRKPIDGLVQFFK